MNFYTQQHKHYCGIDLHARAMYVCILDHSGTILLHKNLPTTPEAFLRILAPYREDLVVGVEYIFTWYWLADLCHNVHLRWAFAEAAVLFLRQNHLGQEYFAKLAHKHGKAKTLTVLARKLGRAVYYMLSWEQAFDLNRFVAASPLRGETEPAAELADNE